MIRGRSGRITSCYLGRAEEQDEKEKGYQNVVNLHDSDRNSSSQGASREHGVLKLVRCGSGLQCYFKDCKDHGEIGRTRLIADDCKKTLSCTEWEQIFGSDVLHLLPEIGPEIYTSGPPVLIGHLVPYNKFQITVSGAPLADRVPAPSSEPEGVRKKQIKVVVDNDQIGILMGRHGSNIQDLQRAYESTVVVSERRIFHPDCYGGRVVLIETEGLLWPTTEAVLKDTTACTDGSGNAKIMFAIPSSVAGRVLGASGGSKKDLRRGMPAGVQVSISPPGVEKTERLLTCSGPKDDLMTAASQILKALGSIPLYEVDVNYSHGRKRARSVSPPRYRVEAADQANRKRQRDNKEKADRTVQREERHTRHGAWKPRGRGSGKRS